MKILRIILLSLLLSLPLSGCLYQFQTTSVVSVNDEISQKIKVASKDVPPEDKVTLYKIFKGFSSLINSAIPDSTIDAWSQLDKVKQIYGWDTKKYPEVTAAVKEILDNPKYNSGTPFKTPQKTSEIKDKLVPVLESIAEGFR